MSARSFLLSIVVSIAAGLGVSVPAGAAQEAAQLPPEVPTAKYQFSGVINANAVYVRSGASENYYPTMRLDRGTQVTVVGERFGWLKVLPPEGSFSVVGRNLLDKQADGVTGIIKADNVNVRAGSRVSTLKVAIQCKLMKGDAVTIVGEEEGYYHIKPPTDAYVYVHQRFVDPVGVIGATTQPTTRPVRNLGPVAARNPREGDVEESTPRIRIQPTTKPAAPAGPSEEELALQERMRLEGTFDRLETEVKALGDKELEDQPLALLLGGYEKLVSSPNLPLTMRRMSDVRIQSLRIKLEAQKEYLSTKRQQADVNARLAALAAERAQIEARLGGKIEVYTAIGTLQATTVQGEDARNLYRLTDPANGRTLCYVRNDDVQFVRLLGQFIGVNGELSSDPQLSKVVRATSAGVVDPARIGKGVSAQIVPSSVLTRGAARPAETGSTATTGNN